MGCFFFKKNKTEPSTQEKTERNQEVFFVTFLLVADENLQGDSSLNPHRHLGVVDETEAGQLQGRLQVLVTFELHLTEVMQHPAGLREERGVAGVDDFEQHDIKNGQNGIKR